MPQYVIGIDLGTTNCTVAYAELDNANIEQTPIQQIMALHTPGKSFSLPSFIYFPLQEELTAQATSLEWNPSRPFAIGTCARERGSELPSRLIVSAKSWLCHPSINRRSPILPMDSPDVEHKMSPLTATTEILRHLKEAWDQEHPSHPFEKQQILITVPASFDPSARELVLEAATEAEYPECVLLEEPQAAFYAWLHNHTDEWRQSLKVGDQILVVDIGGGTTDFSLIGVEEEEGNLTLKRQAVGDHLLLGGDNIDLTLAYLAKGKLEAEGHEIDQWQLQSLIHQCRSAKEQLLGENPPKEVVLTLLGRGSRLIGNSLTTTLTLNEVAECILNGFIPLVSPDEQSPVEKRSGLQQVGLPYVQDPRISCQLAKFLSMSGESDSASTGRFILPTAVLFNGGTLKSAALRQRMMDLLNGWANTLGRPAVKELPRADYDFAVSRGAAYYGLARQGKAIRIRGGTACSYFIGIEEAAPAVPGITPPLQAVCIVPFGMEEGDERELPEKEFSLVLGELAAFRFFSHRTPQLSDGREPIPGMVVRNWSKELTELHPIETRLDKTEEDGKLVRVTLKSKVTELGVLELWCMAHDGRKWKLEFDIRA